MKSLIFGSTAAKYWFPEFREPHDLDILTIDLTGGSDGKVQRYWYGDSSEYIIKNNPHDIYVVPEYLYTIKAAHFGWNIFWEKTARDIIFFQKKGLKLNEELYKLLVKDFTAFFGKQWATLKGKDSKTFFEDAVTRKYDHDSIHEAVAYYDEPLYKRCLVGNDSVLCSRKAFEQMSYEDRLKMTKEEIFVTALERFIIPGRWMKGSQMAYWLSLKKLATTMSSGWFKQFIIDNFSKLYYNTDNYIKKFEQNHNKLKSI